MTYFSEII